MTKIKASKTLIEEKIDLAVDRLIERLVTECLEHNPRFEKFQKLVGDKASQGIEEVLEVKLREVIKDNE